MTSSMFLVLMIELFKKLTQRLLYLSGIKLIMYFKTACSGSILSNTLKITKTGRDFSRDICEFFSNESITFNVGHFFPITILKTLDPFLPFLQEVYLHSNLPFSV